MLGWAALPGKRKRLTAGLLFPIILASRRVIGCNFNLRGRHIRLPAILKVELAPKAKWQRLWERGLS
jgi:hypothetical protein